MYDANSLKDILDKNDDDLIKSGGLYTSNAIVNSWKIIPADQLTNEKDKANAHRLNALAYLFYFAVFVLQKDRFQKTTDLKKNLHFQMCMQVTKDGIKEVIEIPRDHFKSSVYSECFPIWRSLPFTDKDEALIRGLGYGDAYIKWMRRAHNQDARNLLVSETITNAIKLGTKIGNHYANSARFKYLFPEIIPDSTKTWSKDSLHHNRTPKGSQHGEGTYDFIGVGAALQSRHYDNVIEDDLVGRDALASEKVMENTIEYHRLLPGAMDSDPTNPERTNDELIVGNRWSYKDLNSDIRQNESYFNFTTHSALGGCCALHPYGTPIFPEEFSISKLMEYKLRFGSYLFSCQYLNFPINPEDCKFENNNLRYYRFGRDTSIQYDNLGQSHNTVRVKLEHKVHSGDIEPDIYPRSLTRYMIVDPNHAGNNGRCRHAITVTGVLQNPQRIYLLEVWAKACGFEEFINAMFDIAIRWKIQDIYLETIAAQKYLKFHLDYYIGINKSIRPELANITIKELKTSREANAKKMRIDGLAPIFERKEFFVNEIGMDEFHEEYEAYGNKKGLIDVLDTLGYGTQVWKFDNTNIEETSKMLAQRQARFERAISAAQGSYR